MKSNRFLTLLAVGLLAMATFIAAPRARADRGFRNLGPGTMAVVNSKGLTFVTTISNAYVLTKDKASEFTPKAYVLQKRGPDIGQWVFKSARVTKHEVRPSQDPRSYFVIETDGTTIFHPGSKGNGYGDLSADGQHVALVDGSVSAIWVDTPGGNNLRRLSSERPTPSPVSNALWVYDPIWEADRQGVAFRANRDGHYSVWRVDANSGLEEILVDGKRYGDVFAVSQKSGQLFAHTKQGVYRVPTNSGEQPIMVLPGTNWFLDSQARMAAQIRIADIITVAVRSVETGDEVEIPLPAGYDVASMSLGWSPNSTAFAMYVKETASFNQRVAAVFRKTEGKWSVSFKAPPASNLTYTIPGAPEWIDENHAVVNTVRVDVINDAERADPQAWIAEL